MGVSEAVYQHELRYFHQSHSLLQELQKQCRTDHSTVSIILPTSTRSWHIVWIYYGIASEFWQSLHKEKTGIHAFTEHLLCIQTLFAPHPTNRCGLEAQGVWTLQKGHDLKCNIHKNLPSKYQTRFTQSKNQTGLVRPTELHVIQYTPVDCSCHLLVLMGQSHYNKPVYILSLKLLH